MRSLIPRGSSPLPRRVASLALVVSIAEAAPAQIDPGPAANFCRTGRPAPACRTFLLLEGNAYTPVAGSRYSRQGYPGQGDTRSMELTWYVAWEGGGMINLDPANAVGASVLLGADANGVRWGLKGRYRRWLAGGMAVDAGAGILGAGRSVARQDQPGNDHVPAVGVTGDLSLGVVEWASLGLRADVLFSEGGEGPATAYYVGTRLGTKPTLVATALPLVFAAILGIMVGANPP